MGQVRGACDALERVVSADTWPIPSYAELLFAS
jgi:glutamine synthetase type III